VEEDPSLGGITRLFGSIYPAVWSFQLALRSRGLGSTLTTSHLLAEREVGEVLERALTAAPASGRRGGRLERVVSRRPGDGSKAVLERLCGGIQCRRETRSVTLARLKRMY
jgi:hypothetical protein